MGTQWGLTPLCAFLLDCEGHVTATCGVADGYRADGCRPVGAHQSGVETHSRGGEQDLGS